MVYPVIIAPTRIPELNQIEVSDAEVTIGASVTLTDLDDTLKHAIKKMPGKLLHSRNDTGGFLGSNCLDGRGNLF
jgi:xanthine dehydrogenase iron-sulfur cluster and FAD-binding subunit A